ncbi:aminoglycoside phosphotransferase family protein [Streptosporangium sp. NPDC000239]|uniref:aminoglycoside phosphotransferase family protein n=1 Tax=Streptosporangium sp. NPDC000239 TaxID=3154248 RepID=UPI00331987A7
MICHGDFGPWNIVWQGERPVGILDWDYARPRPRLHDIAYALEYVAPFRDDAECLRWLRYPTPPDRRHRLELFATAYGLTSTTGLIDAVIDVQRDVIEQVRRPPTASSTRRAYGWHGAEPTATCSNSTIDDRSAATARGGTCHPRPSRACCLVVRRALSSGVARSSGAVCRVTGAGQLVIRRSMTLAVSSRKAPLTLPRCFSLAVGVWPSLKVA